MPFLSQGIFPHPHLARTWYGQQLCQPRLHIGKYWNRSSIGFRDIKARVERSVDCQESRRETEEEDWKTPLLLHWCCKISLTRCKEARSVANTVLTNLKQISEILQNERAQHAYEVAKAVEEVKVSNLSPIICLVLLLPINHIHFLTILSGHLH